MPRGPSAKAPCTLARWLVAWLLGCSSSETPSRPATADTGATSSSNRETTTGDDTQGAAAIIAAPDGGSADPSCDLFDDDCRPGHKCSAYALPGEDVRTETRCVPLSPTPAGLDEPCTITGDDTEGIDDCDVGLTCSKLDEDGVGVCSPLCRRLDDELTCDDPDRRCRKAEGAMQICLRACNPLDPASCPDEGEACYTLTGWLTCLADASGSYGATGDPCIFTNACDPGLACRPAEVLPGCQGTRCCTPFCDLEAPDPNAACDGALASTCVPWFGQDEAPSNAAHVGLCITGT